MEQLPIRHSVTDIQQVWDTGLAPVLVIADDMQPYVAKHARGLVPSSVLCNELLAHHYAQLWNLPVLDAALMRVDPKHIGGFSSTNCQPRFFRSTCFATRFRKDSVEFNQFLSSTNAYERQRYTNRNDLLRIALFDCWLANDDRTANNPNLLVTTDESGFTLRVMDHEAVFGGNNPDKPLPERTIGDSLLAHPAVAALLGKTYARDTPLVNAPVQDAYLCVQSCEQHTDEILQRLPADWGIELAAFRLQLQERLFDPDRWKAVVQNYLDLLAQC
jgi:hypothetical protein